MSSSSSSSLRKCTSAGQAGQQQASTRAAKHHTISRKSSPSPTASKSSHKAPKWLKLTAEPFIPARLTNKPAAPAHDDVLTTAGPPRGAARTVVGQQPAVTLDWQTAQNTTFEHGFASTPMKPSTYKPKHKRNTALSKADWLALMTKST